MKAELFFLPSEVGGGGKHKTQVRHNSVHELDRSSTICRRAHPPGSRSDRTTRRYHSIIFLFSQVKKTCSDGPEGLLAAPLGTPNPLSSLTPTLPIIRMGLLLDMRGWLLLQATAVHIRECLCGASLKQRGGRTGFLPPLALRKVASKFKNCS